MSAYVPKYILSPEFKGTSNYEMTIENLIKENKEKLEKLNKSPESNRRAISYLEEDLKTLQYLYENYNSGMNVFRNASGGRDKLVR